MLLTTTLPAIQSMHRCRNDIPTALPSRQVDRKLSMLYDQALSTSMRAAAAENKTIEEYSLIKIKERLLRDWHPEYEPESILPPHELRGDFTVSERATLIQLNDIVVDTPMYRKTKVLCTLGPACATPAGMEALLGAGLNIARLNFSHGNHDGHLDMLKLFRCARGQSGSWMKHKASMPPQFGGTWANSQCGCPSESGSACITL
jgi:hypothetical protein